MKKRLENQEENDYIRERKYWERREKETEQGKREAWWRSGSTENKNIVERDKKEVAFLFLLIKETGTESERAERPPKGCSRFSSRKGEGSGNEEISSGRWHA